MTESHGNMANVTDNAERYPKVQGEKNIPCIVLIGMPASGKSTIGAALAERLDWAFMDTDTLLEALYATRLQNIVDSMGKDEFLDTEAAMIESVKANRCVIATGGSVVYRKNAMAHLASLGAIVYVQCGIDCLRGRIEEKPDRGIAMEEGQTLEDLYQERVKLYELNSDLDCESESMNVDGCVEFIMGQIDAGLFERIKPRLENGVYQHD